MGSFFFYHKSICYINTACWFLTYVFHLYVHVDVMLFESKVACILHTILGGYSYIPYIHVEVFLFFLKLLFICYSAHTSFSYISWNSIYIWIFNNFSDYKSVWFPAYIYMICNLLPISKFVFWHFLNLLVLNPYNLYVRKIYTSIYWYNHLHVYIPTDSCSVHGNCGSFQVN